MPRIFNSIRQRLLKENRFTRYLVYAIGEILLVVVGILIALQVNNWNNAAHAEQEELKILEEMRHNLTNDAEDCLWNIRKQEDMLRSNTAVLRHLEDSTPWHDSLETHYGNLTYTTTQRRNMSAYDHLRAKGIDLIRNDSLRHSITAVYSERYYYIERQELEYDNRIQLAEVVPQLNAKVVYDTDPPRGYPIDLERLRADDAFKGTLRMNVNVRRSMGARYRGLHQDLTDLIARIETELHNRR